MNGQNQQQQQQPGIAIEHLHETGMAIVHGICSIITLPIEYWLRPHFGTRYFNPVVTFFSFVMMVFFSAFVTLFSGLGRMLPFHGVQRSAPISFGMLFFAYFVSGTIHNFRTWRLMIHMQLEEHSQFEGPALPFFRLLPKGRSFFFVRIVWEPLFVWGVALTLSRFFLAEWSVVLYLMIAALALFAKNSIEWYKGWQYLRNLLDVKNRGPLLAKFAEGSASDDELAQIHLSQFPQSAPADIRKAAAQQIAGLPPDIEALISPVEPA